MEHGIDVEAAVERSDHVEHGVRLMHVACATRVGVETWPTIPARRRRTGGSWSTPCRPLRPRPWVELIEDRNHVEASGGITVGAVDEYAVTGVDVVSIASLAHTGSSCDGSSHYGEAKWLSRGAG